MERVVYSDNAATTPISKNVYNAMLPYLTTGYGNPSSLYKLGRDEKKAMDEARGHLAKFFNCDPNEIYFTSGGSEADNLAIKGLFFSGKMQTDEMVYLFFKETGARNCGNTDIADHPFAEF